MNLKLFLFKSNFFSFRNFFKIPIFLSKPLSILHQQDFKYFPTVYRKILNEIQRGSINEIKFLKSNQTRTQENKFKIFKKYRNFIKLLN